MSYNIITVTPSTSLILVKKPYVSTMIYLPSYSYANPDFIVTVRDTTGSPLLQTNPIRISTTNGSLFQDLENTYTFGKPYGLARFALRHGNSWQILHTSGQPDSNSAAQVNTLYVNTLFLSTMSTHTKNVSTMVVYDINQMIDPMNLYGNITLSNLSTPGFSLFKSTIVAYDSVNINGRLHVSGPTVFNSSLTVTYLSTLVNSLNALSTLSTGGSIMVSQGVMLSSLSMTSTVQVGTLLTSTLTLHGPLTLRGGISTSMFNILGSITNIGGFSVLSNLSTSDSLSSIADYTVQYSSIFQSTLLFRTALTVGSSILGRGPLYLDSLNATSTLSIYGSTLVSTVSTTTLNSFSNVFIGGPLQISNLFTVGSTLSTYFLQVGSTINVQSTFTVNNTVSSFSSVVLTGPAYILGNMTTSTLSVGKDVIIGGSLTIGGNLSTQNLLAASYLNVHGNAHVQNTVTFSNAVAVSGDTNINGSIKVNGATSVLQKYIVSSVVVSSILVNADLNTTAVNTENYLSIGQLYIQNFLTPINTSTALFSTLSLSSVNVSHYTTNIADVYATSLMYSQNPNPQEAIDRKAASVYVSSGGVFIKGFSTQTLVTSSIFANTITGNFTGDALNISNIFFTLQNVSAFTLHVSSISTPNAQIYNSATPTSTSAFFQSIRTVVLNASNIITPYLKVDVYNFDSFMSNKNSIAYNSASANPYTSFNSTLNTGYTGYVGINTTTPQASLDINGTLYTSSLLFSSISVTNLVGTVISTTFGLASSIYIRDTLVSPVIQISKNYLTASTFVIQNNGNPIQRSSDSIVAYPSSLVFEGAVQVTSEVNAPSQVVRIDPTQVSFTGTTADSMLMVYANSYSSTLKTSSLTLYTQLSSPSISFSTLNIVNNNYLLTKNSVTSYGVSTLAINSTLFLHKGFNTVGINTSPQDYLVTSNFLTIQSNAFFSTLMSQALPKGTLTYATQIL